MRFIETIVGVFMLIGLVCLLVLSLKVSGLNDFYSDRDGYTITADFENVSGLKPRSKVSVAGVGIGRVTKIEYHPDNYTARVTMMIFKDVKNIPEDSRPAILTSGFLGDNYIGITAGFSTTYLKDGSHIDMSNTASGIVLEELVSKFFSSSASSGKK